jgi:D-apiose dehydrogenase
MGQEAMLRGVALGAGYFSHFQYEAWSRLPEVRITAVYNRTESKARDIVERYGIPRHYGDWRQMLDQEKPDFVDIITPPETHEEMCAEVARRGIAIICQKPLAPTLEASQRIVARAEQSGVRFLVHENWRWQPWYREIKRLQNEGLLGDCTHCLFRMRTGDGWGEDAYMARQPFFRDYPRLLVYETGVHFIDTFRFLFGEITEVYANLRRLNPVIRGEETGQLFFRHASGATSILDANRYNESESDDPRFTFGDLRIDAMRGHLTMDTAGTLRWKPLGEPVREIDYPHERKGFAGDCVYALQRHFVDCMRDGTEFESHGRDYLKTLAVVDAVYASASQGEVVKLAIDQSS